MKKFYLLIANGRHDSIALPFRVTCLNKICSILRQVFSAIIEGINRGMPCLLNANELRNIYTGFLLKQRRDIGSLFGNDIAYMTLLNAKVDQWLATGEMTAEAEDKFWQRFATSQKKLLKWCGVTAELALS